MYSYRIDYDLLLLLDERVKKKTVNKTTLEAKVKKIEPSTTEQPSQAETVPVQAHKLVLVRESATVIEIRREAVVAETVHSDVEYTPCPICLDNLHSRTIPHSAEYCLNSLPQIYIAASFHAATNFILHVLNSGYCITELRALCAVYTLWTRSIKRGIVLA